MKKCLYCGKDLEKEPKENYIENKVGYFVVKIILINTYFL